MMTEDTTPLLQHSYTFVLDRINGVTLNLRTANLPTLSIGQRFTPTRDADITMPGDKIGFEDLTLEFIVDDKMINYTQISDWIWEGANPKTGIKAKSVSDYLSDGVLSVYNAHEQIVKQFRFEGCYPTSLGGIVFDNTSQDSTPITANVTLAYSIFSEEGKY